MLLRMLHPANWDKNNWMDSLGKNIADATTDMLTIFER
jgi:hypothetical protein